MSSLSVEGLHSLGMASLPGASQRGLHSLPRKGLEGSEVPSQDAPFAMDEESAEG